MSELRHLEGKETKIDEGEPPIVLPTEAPEYQEYQSLMEHFQGDVLKKLNRRIDLHLMPPIMIVYLWTYIDRANVGNARLFGAQADLGLSGTDWNIGLALMFVAYGVFAPFTNIFVKRYGAKYFLAFIFFGCGATIIGAGCSHNRVQWFAMRMLLGVFEAGTTGACIYLMTLYYNGEMITSRCFYFYLAATMSGAISGLLAYGIGQLDYTWGYRGWRFIYVIEGTISCALAIITIFWIPRDPGKKSGWLSAQEQRFLVLRNKYSYGKNKSGNSFGFTFKDYVSAFYSPHVWILGMSWFTYATAIYAYSFTLPTIIFNMGYTAVNAQALSVPPYIVAFLAVLVLGRLSHRFKSRAWVMIALAFVAFVGLLICYLTAGKTHLVGLTYFACLICALGFYPLTPMFNGWFSVQNAGQTKRAAALSFNSVFTQCGGVLGSNIYLSSQAPYYPLGFGLSFGFILTGNIVLMIAYWWWVGRINSKRAAMTDEEINSKYTPEELEAMGDRSPYYVYSR